ncbi:hypothetical protein [Flavobacterium pectinovorum]|uniref:Signal peptidase n=1 Tax=Flavobacterium pectinovorum TaxID=29533 RepID=A0A502F227_9FLAO|nr:hypothetical protein [Flavobacterium pectinovorum]TPG44083.1 hypothetical protein EAH81_05925 [Flavobacterium pectinovorum]
MKKSLFYTIFFSAILLIQNIAFAQNPPPPGLPDDPVAAPIDSFVYVLFALGIIFGFYIIGKRKKSKL